ncbi:MAG: response regulator transcription factor [Chloroflexota bacterium]|jgi:NarL family two-component system response regulator LiaR
MTDEIRVLIVDDHAVVREGLRALISYEPGMTVVGEAKDGIEAMFKAREDRPDVVLLDLVMPRQDGLATINQLQEELPEVRILVLTSYAEDDKVFTAIKSGALGYLLKDSSPDELLKAIYDVSQGQSSLHPTIARKLIREMRQPTDLPPADDPLTPREMDVLKLVAKGMGNQEIGEELVVSVQTVRTHVSNILGKLHVANRTQAALFALREGIADLDERAPG